MFPKHLSVISPKISMFKVVNITFGLEGWPAEDYQEASASLFAPSKNCQETVQYLLLQILREMSRQSHNSPGVASGS